MRFAQDFEHALLSWPHLAFGRAHFDAGTLFDRLHDLGDVLVGTKFVAGEFQKCRDRLDHLDRNAERFGLGNKKVYVL